MNLTDIVKGIAHQKNVPVATVHKVMTGFVDIVGLSLAAGEEVSMRTFGKFEPRERKAVVRRNPKTGEEIPVPAKTSVGFVPSPNLKARLNDEEPE